MLYYIIFDCKSLEFCFRTSGISFGVAQTPVSLRSTPVLKLKLRLLLLYYSELLEIKRNKGIAMIQFFCK